ncbi:MAG TPA: tetratricopeptide repeat protein [Pyrinomonadaceae bacterium]|nr:tetratricopeptide repeat protein [Pyrinomonadaceae bacterium]
MLDRGLSKSSFVFVVIALLPSLAIAQRDRDTYNPSNQSFEVSGQVNLAGTNSPIVEVPVRLDRFSGGIVDQINTDARGRFRFTNLQRGYYKVIITAAGFAPAQQDADLTLLFKTYLVFALTRIDSNARAITNEVIDARIPPEAREEYSRGRDALAKSNSPEAVAHFQKALNLYSQFFEAQLLLGEALMDLRRWAEAETALTRALEIRADNPAAMFGLGEAYWREKRFDDAERTLVSGLKIDEKNWHGYFTLARVYWEKGDMMKAAPAIGHTLQLKADFAEGHLVAGNILLRLNQPERALIEYEEYLRLAPKGEYSNEARGLVVKLRGNSRRP